MAHKRIIDSVKKQGQVAIKDLDEFLRFVIYEYDMRTFDANYISILIPMKFDIDKVFGLNGENTTHSRNLSAKVRRVVSPPLIIVTGKNVSTSTRPLLAGRISARMLKRCFWISPRATIFPMHICMISLKNNGLPVIPVRIADLRY